MRIDVRPTILSVAVTSTASPWWIGAWKSTDSMCAVTTAFRAWRSATIAAASSIIASATPPKSVPRAFACPGITIRVIVTVSGPFRAVVAAFDEGAGPLDSLRSLGAFGLSSPARGPFGAISRSLRGVERAREVGHEVVLVLDADGDADERVVDAERLPRLGGDARVRHDRGVLDEALDAAERLG